MELAGLPTQTDALPMASGAFDLSMMSGAWPAAARVLLPIQRGQILIVEDDPQVCAAWELLLQGWGVHAMLAEHSAQAIAYLDAGFAPQVILCDERLRSGESGFELLKALLARLPQAHGAMVSGEFSSPALKQAEEEGYLVLRKPVDTELIHGLLQRWLT